MSDKIIIERKQDYAKELFNLSRSPDKEDLDKREGYYHCIVGREWCSDLSNYIIALENKIKLIESESIEVINER